ncbi:hypothetical protein FS749_000189 [Ceratobasidium sp. UAMH 11750]|nr:hypothetical protein FS749_000189 [Ceratobasidium sp. UAMH 11750]
MSVAFSSDGRRVVSGSADQTLRIWDAQTGGALLRPLHGHSDSVLSVAFSSDNRRIVSGSLDRTVRIWDAQTGAVILGPLQGHSGPVASVAFSSDALRIVSGSSDQKVRIWDAQTGAALLHPLQGHSDSVWCVAFSSDGRRIVSSSSDNTVRIWDPSAPFSAFDSCGPFQNFSRVISRELSQLLHEDWVCNPSGERVFWLPRRTSENTLTTPSSLFRPSLMIIPWRLIYRNSRLGRIGST